MSRYDRIPARIEDSHDGDVHSPGTGERSITTEDSTPRRNNTILKRRGSLTTSKNTGSYTSIESNEEDFMNNQGDADNADNDQERSPLHNEKSCSYDDGLDRSNDLPSERTVFPSRSASPRTIYPSISYSGSFDLDDDDDDDILEANLKRYNLDFSSTDKVASLTDGIINDGNPFVRATPNSNRCSKAAKYLWFSFQSVRQQARQRRAHLLLQQTERNWRQSVNLCILTNCDATDSGILLVVAIMIFWILALITVKDLTVRRGGTIAGILCFIIRVATRPLYHYFLQRRGKRQLHHQQVEETSETSPGRKMRLSDGHDHHRLAHSDGTLELHAIRGDSNNADRALSTSVGSDPTVAAI